MIGGAQLLGPGGPQDVMVINQAGAPAQVQPSQVVAMQQPTNVLGKDIVKIFCWQLLPLIFKNISVTAGLTRLCSSGNLNTVPVVVLSYFLGR